METETKNNTSETTQITFKLSQDERQTIEESAGDLELSLSEYCRLKCLMDENTVLEQRKILAEYEKVIKGLKVNLGFYKNSERTPDHYVILEVDEEQRDALERMYGHFMSINQDLSTNLIDALIQFYAKLIKEQYLGFESKITIEEVAEIFYPEIQED
jgi:hypothetical protein